MSESPGLTIVGLIGGVFTAISLFKKLKIATQTLTVTNTRVYGTIDGRNINIPLSKISYASAGSENNTMIIVTDVDSITCKGCGNREEVIEKITTLIG